MTHHHRTAKQRAHARTIAARTYLSASTAVLPPKASGVPRESWWTTASRESFSATAKTHITRMLQSRFAQVSDPTYRE